MSNFFNLNLRDLFRGGVISVGTAFVGLLSAFLQAHATLPDLSTVETWLGAALAAGVVYLSKNLFTNSNDQLGKKDPTTPVVP